LGISPYSWGFCMCPQKKEGIITLLRDQYKIP